MQELERERKKDKGYWAERERIRKELYLEGAEADERRLRRAAREAKAKASRLISKAV